MDIVKGTKVTVNDARKGTYKGIAKENFNTEKDEWYSIVAEEPVGGLNKVWEAGEDVPARRGLCKVSIRS